MPAPRQKFNACYGKWVTMSNQQGTIGTNGTNFKGNDFAAYVKNGWIIAVSPTGEVLVFTSEQQFQRHCLENPVMSNWEYMDAAQMYACGYTCRAYTL